MKRPTKPIVVTRPDGTEVDYPSQSAAARGENLKQSPISEMCRGVRANLKGYKARWKDSATTVQP